MGIITFVDRSETPTDSTSFPIIDGDQINLTFNGRVVRVLSYGGAPPPDINIGDRFTMDLSFLSIVSWTRLNDEPWGPGTSRLFTYLLKPVIFTSPFEVYLPENPLPPTIHDELQGIGTTYIDPPTGGEGLSFLQQYRQFSQDSLDGIDYYRYYLSVNMAEYGPEYTEEDLYYFDKERIISILDRTINDEITSRIFTNSAYIQYSNDIYYGNDIQATIDLTGYTFTVI